MRDVLVLCYHGVAEPAAGPRDVPPVALARQVDLLLRRGYRATTFERAVHAPPSERTLAVTFDDGERSILEHALPVLAERGLPATVFVPSGTVRLPHVLSWDDLALLAAHGWEVGSHGESHRALTTLDDRELERELAGSRRELEVGIGVTCRSLAYPYGLADARTAEAARSAGYTAACVLGERPGPPSPLAWPRVGIGGADGEGRFRVKVSPLVRRARGTRAGPALSRLASRLASR